MTSGRHLAFPLDVAAREFSAPNEEGLSKTAAILLIATVGLLPPSLQERTQQQAPEISGVTPAAPARSSKPQTLTVNGKNFMMGLTLTVTRPDGQSTAFKDADIQARRETSFQISMLIDQAGAYSLVVTNRDGGTSEPFVLKVDQPRAADSPSIERIEPAEPTRQVELQTLRILGQRFASGLQAILTDPAGADVTDVQVTKVTQTSFELSARLDKAGDYSLVVTNPSGAVSNVARIPVR